MFLRLSSNENNNIKKNKTKQVTGNKSLFIAFEQVTVHGP